MEEFRARLSEVPQESLLLHADRNHFSAWLMARGEIQFAISRATSSCRSDPSASSVMIRFSSAITRIRRCTSSAFVISGMSTCASIEGAPPSLSHLDSAFWRCRNAVSPVFEFEIAIRYDTKCPDFTGFISPPVAPTTCGSKRSVSVLTTA